MAHNRFPIALAALPLLLSCASAPPPRREPPRRLPQPPVTVTVDETERARRDDGRKKDPSPTTVERSPERTGPPTQPRATLDDDGLSQPLPPSSPRLVHVASGMCLDAGAARAGTPLRLSSCNDSDAQTFVLRPIYNGGGRVRIVHLPSGLCVDPPQLGACNGAPAQAYTRGYRDGGFQLADAQSRRCVDAGSDGGRLLQSACRNGAGEIWRLAGPAPEGSHDVPTGPILDQADAEQRCRLACSPPEHWNGRWRATIPGRTSVCGCAP
jgi:hypothetical protein